LRCAPAWTEQRARVPRAPAAALPGLMNHYHIHKRTGIKRQARSLTFRIRVIRKIENRGAGSSCTLQYS
jgi:hypothetical protein